MHNEYGVSKEVFRDLVHVLKWYAGKPLSPRFKLNRSGVEIIPEEVKPLSPDTPAQWI